MNSPREELEKQLQRADEVVKNYNKNHDGSGRFSSGPGGSIRGGNSSGSVAKKVPNSEGSPGYIPINKSTGKPYNVFASFHINKESKGSSDTMSIYTNTRSDSAEARAVAKTINIAAKNSKNPGKAKATIKKSVDNNGSYSTTTYEVGVSDGPGNYSSFVTVAKIGKTKTLAWSGALKPPVNQAIGLSDALNQAAAQYDKL